MAAAAALVDDLMFVSRIREAARPLGIEVRVCRRAEDLLAACTAGAGLVVVDLDSARLPTEDAVRRLRADPALADLPVVGFVSHVHADRIQAARGFGVTRVLARSAFVQELPALLSAIR
jgi:CheY-like chemotaxis protein